LEGVVFAAEQSRRRFPVWILVVFLLALGWYVLDSLRQAPMYKTLRKAQAVVVGKRVVHDSHSYEFRQPDGTLSHPSYDDTHWFVSYRIVSFEDIDPSTAESLLDRERLHKLIHESSVDESTYGKLEGGDTVVVTWEWRGRWRPADVLGGVTTLTSSSGSR
jgi:hypothetical protein